MDKLLKKIVQCDICKNYLPLGPRPVVQLSPLSKIIIIGQAPGKKVHETGIAWNDASGKKLREWLGVDDTAFYNADLFSLMPMGFCYPGKGNSGDLAPRVECAPQWHEQILKQIKTKPLVLLIGQYSRREYLNSGVKDR